jgi:ubiquinone/menaquinone biosynthesis C-methylase UbiE
LIESCRTNVAEEKDPAIVNYRAKARVNEIQECLPVGKHKLPDQITYLDIGCGDGKMTLKIADILKIKPDKVYGVDVESFAGIKIINVLKKNYAEVKDNDFTLPHEDRKFNLVTLFQVLHHCSNPHRVIQEAIRVLKPGSYLIIREHDAEPEDYPLIDFEHLLYPGTATSVEKYYGKYQGSLAWDRLIGLPVIGFTMVKGPTRYYTKAYYKSK